MSRAILALASTQVVAAIMIMSGNPDSGRVSHAEPLKDGQWYVASLRLASAHKLSTGKGIVVAVIDSGVDATHQDILGSVIPGADFSNSDTTSTGDGRHDDEGHGTGMASLLVGHGQVSGVAPDSRVLPVRVAGEAMRTNFATGIQWAVDHGADVISISGGAPLADPREKRAIEDAIRQDIVVVAAVGNAPESKSVQYPARYAGVLAVGAITQAGAHASISVIGPEVMLSAPGEGISLASLNHEYATSTGTSNSTAIVSGVAALVRSRFPAMTAQEVIHRLTATATDVAPPGRDEVFGYGVVNPVGALSATVLPSQGRPTSTVTSSVKEGAAGTDDLRGSSYLVFVGAGVLALVAIAGAAALLILHGKR